jgi:predicted O-methyltransferase YrrM
MIMEFLDPELDRYVESHTQAESPLLQELNRHTHLKVLQPRMLSGHLQGRILSMFSKMIVPENILEIGTYTGYSAICLSEGLAVNGRIHTIEKNPELKALIDEYFAKAGIQDRITLHIGDALEIIEDIEEKFDLVFIDADKANYINYYRLVLPMVSPGGYIIADNVLWSGKVLSKSEMEKDQDAKTLHEFNKMVLADDSVENVLFPVRDGLMVIRKKDG